MNKKNIFFSFFLLFLFYPKLIFAMQNITQYIYQNKNNFGLIIVTQSGCGACKDQYYELKKFYEKYEFLIQEFDIHKNKEITSLFKIKSTPTILLISKKTKEFIIIGEGYVELSDLEVDVFKGIHYLKNKKEIHLY